MMPDIERKSSRNGLDRDRALSFRLRRWIACAVLAAGVTAVLSGCAKVPRRYVWMAEPGVTLTALAVHPESYVGKVVLLGGAIIEEDENEEYLWLRLKNRPLDQDYVPHRPPDMEGPESGSYWVVVGKQQLPRNYRDWARTTVAGRVLGTQRLGTEPVLALIYMRGWSASGKDAGVWEHIDPNYVPMIPAGLDPLR